MSAHQGFPLGPLQIPAVMWQEMLDHVRQARPHEGCGLVAGKAGAPTRFFPCRNNHPSPITRYRVDDQELLQAIREMDDNGWELLAIFHSHPASRAYPSPTDVAQAHYPESIYLIVSLQDPEQPDLHGFWIRNGQITEHRVEIV